MNLSLPYNFPFSCSIYLLSFIVVHPFCLGIEHFAPRFEGEEYSKTLNLCVDIAVGALKI
jgi:hypothetical protein